MLLKYAALTALTLTLSACASKRLKTDTEMLASSAPNIALEITSEIVREYSDKYNKVLQLNFASQDGHWIRIEKAYLEFDEKSDASPHNIIIGRDLSDWLNAKAEERKIQKQNEDVGGLGLLTLGAAAIALGSSNKSAVTAAGAVAAGGGAGMLLRKEYREAKDAAHQPNWVPDTHLYAPFNIPSMSFVKRWVLINSPSGDFGRYAVLKIRTVEGENLDFKVSLRK